MLAMAGKREALAVDVVELSIEGAEPARVLPVKVPRHILQR
jgi:hypothetical protein